jgi:hypothetical protein
MESTFPFGGRCEVGFTAIIKQARTRGKYWIKREACALQSDSSKKGEIEVGPRPGLKWEIFKASIAVARLHTPSGYASEAYTLREHVALVRRAVLARTTSRQPAAIAAG